MAKRAAATRSARRAASRSRRSTRSSPATGRAPAKCVPGTKVLVGYSQDFIAQDKCKAVAQNQIAAGCEGRLRGRRPVRLRRPRGGEGGRRLGRRRRRRPVVPRPAHPDERGQARRSRRLPLRPGGPGRHARARPRLRLRPEERRRRARQDQPEGAGGLQGEDRRAAEPDRSTGKIKVAEQRSRSGIASTTQRRGGPHGPPLPA